MLYSDLTTNIQSYVENTFTTAQLNTFITQAEQRIFNTVQLPELKITINDNLVAGNPYYNIPANFLSTFSFAVIDYSGNYNYLLNKDSNYIREAYPQMSYQAMPVHYGIYGPQTSNPLALQFIVGPTPDNTYQVELQYFHYPQSIVTANETWLGDNFDSALLWGSIVEAYHFLKGEPQLMSYYQQRYQESLALLKMLGDGKNRQDAYRSGQIRDAVR